MIRNERTAGRRIGVLDGVEADVREHGAHSPCLGFVAFFERGERVDLTAFDPVERFLEPCQHRIDIAVRSRLRYPGEGESAACAVLRPHIARGRGAGWGGRGDRRRLRWSGGLAGCAGRAQRAGHRGVGDRAHRCRPLFEQRLPADDLVELLLELLLVEQLAARHPVHLGAHIGDAVFIGELHFGLAGDHAGQHVVLECEIGGGDHAPSGHDHEGSDHRPECHRANSELTAAMAEGERAPILVASLARAGWGGLGVARPFAGARMLGAAVMVVVMVLAAPVTVVIRLSGIMTVVGGVRLYGPR